MLTTVPPTRPIKRLETIERPLKMYTLHENYNNILAFRAERDGDKTATIAFTRQQDVLKMGIMLEAHYRTYKEWPDMILDNSIKIYSGNAREDLSALYVVEWSYEELNTLCAGHYMDILHIESLVENNTGFNIRGSLVKLACSNEFYIGACNRMLKVNMDGTVSTD